MRKRPKNGKLVKGLSIDSALYEQALTCAQRESRSFSFVVCRALERDIEAASAGGGVQPAAPVVAITDGDDLIDTREVAKILRVSVFTVRRRAATKGDPLRKARSRLGKQRPMQFHLSKIRELERERASA